MKDHDLERRFKTPGDPNLAGAEWDDPGEWVDCPACSSFGEILPGAKAGHWAGLMPWPADLRPEPCDLCSGSGEVPRIVADEYEARECYD